MENPGDHKRLYLLNLLVNQRSRKQQLEFRKLASIYGHPHSQWSTRVLNKIEEELKYAGFLKDDGHQYVITETGKNALKYYAIPSETRDNRIKNSRWKIATYGGIAGTIVGGSLRELIQWLCRIL